MSEDLIPAEKVERWLQRLHSPDEAKRIHAAMRLAGTGVDPQQIRTALEAARIDPDPHISRLAAWVLDRLETRLRQAG